MVWVRSFVLILTHVLSSVNVVRSTDIAVLEYLLNDKLTSWKNNVTQQIKVDVLQEIQSTVDIYTNTISGNEIQAILQKYTQRVTSLEAENKLLNDMAVKWQNNVTKITNVTNFNLKRRGLTLAIAEHKSGNVFLIAGEGESRWTVTSSKGILGMVYHPINKMLYTVTAYRTSAIHSVNVYSHQQNVLRKCGQCIAIGLDTKENILYFIQNSLKTTKSYVLRLNLNPTELNRKPFLKYTQNQSPAALAVDDTNKHVFVVLRGKGVIQQVDYTGKMVREIAVDPVIEERYITFSMTLNVLDKVLYFTIDSELWRTRLGTDEDPEFLDVSDLPKLSGLFYVNKKLIMGYMNSSRIDGWTEERGFHQLMDLGIVGKSGSKHICLFD